MGLFTIPEREGNMQDRVGAIVPTNEQVTAWLATINKLQQEIAPYGVGLTPDERRHTLKFRPGGETIVHALAVSVRKHDISLPGITADGMEADLSVAEQLKPVRDAVQSLYLFTDDTILEASSECWYAATAYYTTLTRMVSNFPDIKAVVTQVATFFATRRRKKAQAAQQAEAAQQPQPAQGEPAQAAKPAS